MSARAPMTMRAPQSAASARSAARAPRAATHGRAAEQRDELAPFHGLPSSGGSRTLPHRCARAVPCSAAKLIVEWQRRVKMRKSHGEHFSTAVPQKADVVLNAANGSFVPQHKIAAR